MITTDSPRIYVASLSDYNAGRLHGVWIDAAQDADAIAEEVTAMLADSPESRICQWCGKDASEHGAADGTNPDYCRDARGHRFMPGNAEEWAIHDYEGFAGIRLSEYESFENVAALAELIEEFGPAYAAFYDNEGGAEYATRERFEEDYCGEWDSIEDYARNLAEDCGMARNLAEDCGMVDPNATWPNSYIDWERAARDLIIGGDNWTADNPAGGIFVFRAS